MVQTWGVPPGVPAGHLSKELEVERVPLSVAWRSPTLTKTWQGAVRREARRRKAQRAWCQPGALPQPTAGTQARGQQGERAGLAGSPEGSATSLPSGAS